MNTKLKRYKSHFTEGGIPKAPAYWISPRGKILPIFDDDKHINQILENPKVFGFTTEEIEKIYDAEGEQLGSEGNARERIIKRLILEGWIRIRRYMKQDTFTVNISRMNKKVKNYLYQWAVAMRDLGLRYSQVRLDMPNQNLAFSIDDIANDALFQESLEDKLEVVDNVSDL